MFRFNSKIILGESIPEFSEAEIKNENMFFSCNIEFARKHGGPLTHAFLDRLDPSWDDAIIDSRSHMLMTGWWPCIPGWHHDDVPRTRPGDMQPNYHNPSYRSEHVMCLANGEICPTEYALGEADFPEVPVGQLYYKVWHPIVQAKIDAGELISYSAPSNRLIYFDDRSWHQGTEAVKPGWRWFIRASRKTERKFYNEIRKQVQVYLSNPMEGW